MTEANAGQRSDPRHRRDRRHRRRAGRRARARRRDRRRAHQRPARARRRRGAAKRVIDASGCLVIPGGIDPHVHYALDFQGLLFTEGPEYTRRGGPRRQHDRDRLRLPGAAARPLETIARQRAQLEGRMAVDWGLHAILTRDFIFEDIEQIGDVIRGGIPTIKTMMTYGWMSDDGRRYGVMCEVAEQGGMSVVHAEDDAIANWLHGEVPAARARRTAPTSARCAVRWSRRRRCAARCSSPSAPARRCTSSTWRPAAAIEALAESRARGLPFYGETLAATSASPRTTSGTRAADRGRRQGQ